MATVQITTNVNGGTMTLYYKADSLPVKVSDTITYKGITGKVIATGPMPGSKNWYITFKF